MRIEGHYDPNADIAWLRLEGYEPIQVVTEEVEFGLKEVDLATGRVVGLEYWHASGKLPRDFLSMLPLPPIGVAG